MVYVKLNTFVRHVYHCICFYKSQLAKIQDYIQL